MGNCDCSEGIETGYPQEFAAQRIGAYQTPFVPQAQAKPVCPLPIAEPTPEQKPEFVESSPPPSLLESLSRVRTSVPPAPAATESPMVRSSVRKVDAVILPSA